MTRATLRLLLALSLLGAGCAPVTPGQPAPDATVAVQIVALNDFHGNVELPTGSAGRVGTIDAGGVEYLATHVERLKTDNPNTLVVSAGDNIGATPLLSSMFHDEPTIEALGALGLQLSAVGNHELDEGWVELLRMQKGGCHPIDGCQDGSPFAGAAFTFLAANILVDPARADPAALTAAGWKSGAQPATLVPGSIVKEIAGVKIGFIGLTLQRTPEIVTPAGVAGLTFTAEPDAANAAAAALRRQGVGTIIVLMHQGGRQAGGHDGCDALAGPIVDLAARMSDDIDVIVSGHTHQAYNCTLGSKLVTSAGYYGRLLTDIDLQVDRRTGRVVSKQARNIIVSRDVGKAPALTALIAGYRPFADTIGRRVVGRASAPILRQVNAAGESSLGDVVADALLDASRGPAAGGAVVALTNPGGLRADLVGGEGHVVTFADVFAVLPFGNVLIVQTLSGDALLRLLEQQFADARGGGRTVLQVSNGFTYTYNSSRPSGQRVDRGSVTINGVTVRPEADYRVAMPDFLWSGGDGFSVLAEGRDPTAVRPDHEALAAYFKQRSTVTPGPQNRIRREH